MNATALRPGNRGTSRSLLGLLILGAALPWSLPAAVVPARDKARHRDRDEKQAPSQLDGRRAPASLDDALQRAEASRVALKDARDYTAVFSKTEQIDRKTRHCEMDIKVREQPFSVYLRSRSKPNAGREIVYIAGAHGGNMLVHESGLKSLAGLIEVAPDDPRALKENRRPITQIGMANLLAIETELWRKDRDSDAANVEVALITGTSVDARDCDVVEIRHLRRRSEQQFHLTRLYFDSATNFPVQVEHFDWPDSAQSEPLLVEKYSYADIRTNVGLTASEFKLD